jgi:hypothetical protein
MMSKVLVLRTCNSDMTAHGGFVWPTEGPVEAPDWNPKPRCGGGLHGCLWGAGTIGYYDNSDDAKWLVVEVEVDCIVDLGDKVKFPRGVVVFCGCRHDAAKYIADRAPKDVVVNFTTVTAGDNCSALAGHGGIAIAGHRGTATAGEGGTAIAGDEGTAISAINGKAIAGDRGTALVASGGISTAGEHGRAEAGYRGKAYAGYNGTASAGYRGMASAGDYGTATAGDLGKARAGHCGNAMAGYRGHAESLLGGSARAGDGGTISIWWHDGERPLLAVGYVGEDGIEPNVAYRLDNGKFVKA